MPAPDPVAEAITRGLQAMIADDPDQAPSQQAERPKGIRGLLRRLRKGGKDGRDEP